MESNQIYYVLPPLALISVYLIKQYFRGAQCKSKKRLDGKVVIVTGANCGIGYEAALDFAKRGAHVILACRDMKRAQNAAEKIISESKNTKVEIEILDCASFKSVREFCARINKRLTRLDILVNNAGLTQEIFRKTIDGFEVTFQVNYLSQFLMTNLLLDLLKASAPSRVVQVSALAGKWCKMNWDDLNLENNYGQISAYKQSKLAQVLFTLELARRYGDQGILAASLHPGGVETEIFRNIIKNPLFAFLFILIQPIHWLCMKNPRDGAQTTIHCALDDELVNNNGCYFNECKVEKFSVEGSSLANAERLWKLSETLVGLGAQKD